MFTPSVRKAAFLLSISVCVGLVLALVVPQKGEAQVLYGSIVGNVKDPSGAAVPRATITVTNKGTNLTREAITDESGGYSFADLQTGPYTLRISQPGFKTFEQTEVTVSLNNVSRVDITLQVGEVSETVTVTEEAARLQTETPEVHTDLVAHELVNLPVPLGRNYQQLFRALPGFSPPVNSHSVPTNPARSLEFNVNGTSNSSNTTRVDGVSTYLVLLPHVVSYIPTLESLQEVNIVTNSPDAEQGLAGGAFINLQTKSGTNQTHGSLFEYHSNNYLKAWPNQIDAPELNTGNKPKLVYNQFGGTVGGAIKKDKLFYFVSYEGTYDRRAVQRRVTVPSVAMKKGDFSASDTPIYDPLTGNADGSGRTQFSVSPGDPNYGLCDTATNPQCFNILPAARMDSIALKLAALIPNPNLSGTRNNYFASGPFAFDRHQVDTKINYSATPKLNLSGTFGVLHYSSSVPTVFGDELVGRPIGGSSNPGRGNGETYRLTVMGTYTFTPNVVLDAHLGWSRQETASEQPGLGINIGSDVLGIPGTNGSRRFESGWPLFEFNGADDFATLGVDSNFMPYYRRDPQYQYVANLSWVKGKHNLRFGTDLYHMGLNDASAEFLFGAYGGSGGFNFERGPTLRCEKGDGGRGCDQTSADSRSNSFASFMLGLPTVASRTLQVPDRYQVGTWLISAYARDRWSITPKLTVDYGLRWEYLPVPSRPDRGIENYDPSINKVLLCGFGQVPKNCGFEVSKRLFAPRMGLAYRASDSLVIRAGYGLTNDPYQGLEFVHAAYPIIVPLNSQTSNSLFPVSRLADGIPLVAAPDPGNGIIDIPNNVGFTGFPRKFQRGYIQSWNLTVQKELPLGFAGQVGYVATRTTRQQAMIDINAGQVIGAGVAGRPLYGPYGREATTGQLRPVGNGTYDSLQAQLQRRFTSGLALTVNYTWGKAINYVNSSDNVLTDYSKVQALQYFYLNRARTDFDRTHNFAVTNVWQLPFGKGKHWLSSGGAASAILGGWQVNTLLSLISGPPFTIFADDTALNMPGSSQRADQVGPVRKLGGIGASSPFYDQSSFAEVNTPRFGTSGFNILNGPGIVNWDFGLFREFSLSERFKLQFRIESFNFTNTPHFDLPNGSVSDGSDFMTITGVTNLAREGIDERQFRFGLRISF